MTAQLDMFAAGEADALPPWLDPEKCADYSYGAERDTDHVGAEDIGKVGNDGACIVVTAQDRNGQIIKAWRYERREVRAASEFYQKMWTALRQNRQRTLLIHSENNP